MVNAMPTLRGSLKNSAFHLTYFFSFFSLFYVGNTKLQWSNDKLT